MNQLLPTNHDIQLGQLIIDNRYRVEAFINEGHFGQVYKVKDLQLNVPRAIKVIDYSSKKLTDNELDNLKERFEKEVYLGARLTDSNVVKAYDLADNGVQLFLVMEYINGGSLQEKLEPGALSIEEAIKITIELTKGLEAIHKLNAVHRDVKPSNILLDNENQVRIADLGIAQLDKGASYRYTGASKKHAHLGTPEYMSPEQESEVGYLTPSSDIYSLGCVLFEMLTKKQWKHERASFDIETDLPQLNPDISPELAKILHRMLLETPGVVKKDRDNPNKRYVTMVSVRKDLEKLKEAKKHLILNSQRLIVLLVIVLLTAIGMPIVALTISFPTPTPLAIELTTMTTVPTETLIATQTPANSPTKPLTIINPTETNTTTHTPSPPDTATSTPTDTTALTATYTPSPPDTATSTPTDTTALTATYIPSPTDTATSTPTPISLPPAPLQVSVTIDDKESQQDPNAQGNSFRLLKWKPWASDNAPEEWYYIIRFLPNNDPNSVYHVRILKPRPTIPDANGWLTYSLDINTLPATLQSCYPFWDVIVAIDADKVICPNSQLDWEGICRLSTFSTIQQNLATSHPGVTCSGSSSGERGGSGSSSGGGGGPLP